MFKVLTNSLNVYLSDNIIYSLFLKDYFAKFSIDFFSFQHLKFIAPLPLVFRTSDEKLANLTKDCLSFYSLTAFKILFVFEQFGCTVSGVDF